MKGAQNMVSLRDKNNRLIILNTPVTWSSVCEAFALAIRSILAHDLYILSGFCFLS